MDSSTVISIIAVLISPIIATLLAVWIGEEIRRKNYQKEREDKLLEKLIANRYIFGSVEFLSALNSIDFVFSNNKNIKELVKNLHRAYINKENVTVINQRIVELIYDICKYKKYNITEYEIQNLFIPAQTQIIAQNPTQNPPSTAGNSNNIQQSITTSNSEISVMGDYLFHKEIKEIESSISLGIPGWIGFTKKITKIKNK